MVRGPLLRGPWLTSGPRPTDWEALFSGVIAFVIL